MPTTTTCQNEPTGVDVAPEVELSIAEIDRMLNQRDEYQLTKFRSTASDCVPNL